MCGCGGSGARMTEFMCLVLFGQIYGSTAGCRSRILDMWPGLKYLYLKADIQKHFLPHFLFFLHI